MRWPTHRQLDADLQALLSLSALSAGQHFITDETNEEELKWIASVLSVDEVFLETFAATSFYL